MSQCGLVFYFFNRCCVCLLLAILLVSFPGNKFALVLKDLYIEVLYSLPYFVVCFIFIERKRNPWYLRKCNLCYNYTGQGAQYVGNYETSCAIIIGLDLPRLIVTLRLIRLEAHVLALSAGAMFTVGPEMIRS